MSTDQPDSDTAHVSEDQAPVVVSVNVARPIGQGRYRTAIDKHPVEGPVEVGARNLAGDHVADRKFHGHPHMALYAYAREDLDFWGEHLQASLRPGVFGDNLTTSGVDLNSAVIGERWQVGTTVLRVAWVRIPCSTFARHMEAQGFSSRGWVKKFTQAERTGAYLAVEQVGVITAGDPITVLSKPGHKVTVRRTFAAVTFDQASATSLVGAAADLPADFAARLG